MTTSATSETAETATASVQGRARFRKGSLAKLSLEITGSFAFRRGASCGGRGTSPDVERITRREVKRQKSKGKGLSHFRRVRRTPLRPVCTRARARPVAKSGGSVRKEEGG